MVTNLVSNMNIFFYFKWELLYKESLIHRFCDMWNSILLVIYLLIYITALWSHVSFTVLAIDDFLSFLSFLKPFHKFYFVTFEKRDISRRQKTKSSLKKKKKKSKIVLNSKVCFTSLFVIYLLIFVTFRIFTVTFRNNINKTLKWYTK